MNKWNLRSLSLNIKSPWNALYIFIENKHSFLKSMLSYYYFFFHCRALYIVYILVAVSLWQGNTVGLFCWFINELHVIILSFFTYLISDKSVTSDRGMLALYMSCVKGRVIHFLIRSRKMISSLTINKRL